MGALDGKTALVTGAGRGIGRATAELFAAEGAEVWLVARTAETLDEVVGALALNGATAVAVPGDVTDEAFVTALFDRLREERGRLDILVNNAGVAPGGPIEGAPADELRRCLELNIVGVYLCMQHAVRLMTEMGGHGKIVNIGSVRSHWTESGSGGAYNASKYGLRGMTESVARQLHGSGLNIAVGMVCPGVVDTPLTNPSREPRPDWLQPEDIARAVLHAATAPPGVNVFDTVVIPLAQRPW